MGFLQLFRKDFEKAFRNFLIYACHKGKRGENVVLGHPNTQQLKVVGKVGSSITRNFEPKFSCQLYENVSFIG